MGVEREGGTYEVSGEGVRDGTDWGRVEGAATGKSRLRRVELKMGWAMVDPWLEPDVARVGSLTLAERE
jgi:hypothetical protein